MVNPSNGPPKVSPCLITIYHSPLVDINGVSDTLMLQTAVSKYYISLSGDIKKLKMADHGYTGELI